MTRAKKIVFTALATVVLIGGGAYLVLSLGVFSPSPVVRNFDECVAAGYPVGESHPRQCWTPDGRSFVEEIEPITPPNLELVTRSGEITCLTKFGDGPQTMECALGLTAADGSNYGLTNLFQFDTDFQLFTVGTEVEITGLLSREELRGPDGNRYDTHGVIEIESIRKLAQ